LKENTIWSRKYNVRIKSNVEDKVRQCEGSASPFREIIYETIRYSYLAELNPNGVM
jgi:hypothetical protein